MIVAPKRTINFDYISRVKTGHNKTIFLIVAIGALLRLIFILFVGRYYFGRENIFYDHDTGTWALAIQNLFDYGKYTVDVNRDMGYFMRMPGYSFFMIPFWFLAGKDWWAAFPLIGWFQTLLDIVNIWFVYKLACRIFHEKSGTALVLAALYACYPFIIVWNPMTYSELIAISLMLYSLWFISKKTGAKQMFFSGILMGLSVLFRPQIALLIPVTMLGIWGLSFNWTEIKNLMMPFAMFILGIGITYGLWPARNYINHGKLIFSQNLTGIDQWHEDMMEFRQFIYSVKAEWDPQFSQIISNKPVTYPAPGLLNAKDSLDLLHAMEMSKQCAIGFSRWTGYWKAPVYAPGDCSAEVAGIYRRLRLKQAEDNPWNYYVKIPLQNLHKAIFKFSLTDTSSATRKIASLLFILRTTLILCGIAGLVSMIRQSVNPVMSRICLLYFMLLYFYLCFGTGDQCRNIEIRYFLPADILLLIPAAFFIEGFLKKRNSGNSHNTAGVQ